MADFQMKSFDTLPAIAATLSYTSGPALDLTGSTVKFIMRSASGIVKVNSSAVIVTPAAPSVVRYDWVTNDTRTPDSYTAEWEVTFPNAKKMTFPTATYHTVVILADLDSA